jgi:hypothetical protein
MGRQLTLDVERLAQALANTYDIPPRDPARYLDVAVAIVDEYAGLARAACGAPAVGGACVLAEGHNMGRADIPANHRAASA